MINIIGEFLGTTGYANHTRYLANELNKLIPVKLTTQLNPGWERLVNDQELEMIKRKENFETNLIITHPLYWRANLNAKINIVYLVWEGDRVPYWVLKECYNEQIDKIICPSQHTKQAVISTAKDYMEISSIKKKIVVIPHGVDKKTFYPEKKEPHKNFRFLANKGLTSLEDRGGIQYLIKAYLQEFKPEEKVELVLKINPAYGIPNLLEMFPELSGPIPKITFIHENYNGDQLRDLYNKCDVFVSPTRAEAFNLPCLEACACGKPVITTTFGGQNDFIDNSNGWLIGGEKTEIDWDLQYEGVSWITPRIEDLKVTLRYAFENKESVLRKGSAALHTSERFQWARTAERILDLLKMA